MARYIDADKLKEKILKERDAIPTTRTERYSFGVEEIANRDGNAMRGGIRKALRCMEQTPTADVAPRSEVEALEKEIDRLNHILNCYALQYGTVKDQSKTINKVKTEVAREIFEEIEESIAVHTFTSKSEDYADGMYDAIEWVDSKIAELKKKYTEGGE